MCANSANSRVTQDDAFIGWNNATPRVKQDDTLNCSGGNGATPQKLSALDNSAPPRGAHNATLNDSYNPPPHERSTADFAKSRVTHRDATLIASHGDPPPHDLCTHDNNRWRARATQDRLLTRNFQVNDSFKGSVRHALAGRVDLAKLDGNAKEHLTHANIVMRGERLAKEFFDGTPSGERLTKDFFDGTPLPWTIIPLPSPQSHLFRVYSAQIKGQLVRATICLEYDLEEAAAGKCLPKALLDRVNRARSYRGNSTLDRWNGPSHNATLDLRGGDFEWDFAFDRTHRLFVSQRWSLPGRAREPERERAKGESDDASASTRKRKRGTMWQQPQLELSSSVERILAQALAAEQRLQAALRALADSSLALHKMRHLRAKPRNVIDINAKHNKLRCRLQQQRIIFQEVTTNLSLWAQALSLPAHPIEPSRSCDGNVFGALHAHLRASGTSRAALDGTNYNVEIKDYRKSILPFLYGVDGGRLLRRMREAMSVGFPRVYKKYNDVQLHPSLLNVAPKRAYRSVMTARIVQEMEQRRAALMSPWCLAAINMPTTSTGMTAHRNKRDAQWGLCVVTALGNFTGAALCLDDVGIAIHNRAMDVTIFPSALCTHRNADTLVGTRMSIVAFTQQAIPQRYSQLPTCNDFPVWLNVPRPVISERSKNRRCTQKAKLGWQQQQQRGADA
ncbi:2OGFeDO domain, nucleic acid-modifying type [Ceraceosorus bombacis]|uniref:2OGFeDO domain, nucleic acid-modifying type n=1 Tax=Ceraceosorus bombacis TaxID=401625 RepID=A0A0P1BD29_9BASI|nr:2OGFeDO domain, nucleic acid-modifying type [Ceraceosorus bombacis]